MPFAAEDRSLKGQVRCRAGIAKAPVWPERKETAPLGQNVPPDAGPPSPMLDSVFDMGPIYGLGAGHCINMNNSTDSERSDSDRGWLSRTPRAPPAEGCARRSGPDGGCADR